MSNLKKQAREALKEGRITHAEYEYLLQSQRPVQKGNNTRITIALIMVLVIVLSIITALTTTIPTGFTIQEWNETVFNTTTTIQLQEKELAGLLVSGNLTNGTASIILSNGTKAYRVYSADASMPRVWMEQSVYDINQTIQVIVNAQDYTLWLTDSQGNKTPISSEFSIGREGNYTIEALINETTITKESAFVSIIQGGSIKRDLPVVMFDQECQETCTIIEGDNLSITFITNGILTITGIYTNPVTQNEAPRLIATIPDVTLEINETHTINLSEYFLDEDEVIYDINNMIGVQENIEKDIAIITPVSSGTYKATIYASDLESLTQSSFMITAIAPQSSNTSNPSSTINETSNATPDISNQTQNVSTNCNDPDPNKRPLECIQEQSDLYFQDQPLFLEHPDRSVAARITPIGNILIAGDLVEYSTGGPRQDEFVVSKYDAFGRATVVAWVDRVTGDLHLQGRIHEEQLNLNLPKGAFTIQNKQSINVAYIDKNTGDLYIRGNLIPYRRNLNER